MINGGVHLRTRILYISYFFFGLVTFSITYQEKVICLSKKMVFYHITLILSYVYCCIITHYVSTTLERRVMIDTVRHITISVKGCYCANNYHAENALVSYLVVLFLTDIYIRILQV